MQFLRIIIIHTLGNSETFLLDFNFFIFQSF